MTESIMDVDVATSYLSTVLQTKKVRVQEIGRRITIIPIDEAMPETKYACPFLGIAADSNLTVEKFLEWKREERAAEYEKELRT
jgi:hypothetical protein